MGLMPDQLYSLTPREFDNMLFGYRKKEEAKMRTSWEQARMQVWAALAPHQKKNANITPEKILPFHWDPKRPQLGGDDPEAEKAKIDEIVKMYERLDAQKN